MTEPASKQPFDLTLRNPEIMLRHLPEDIHATVEQVSANVSQSLDKLFTEFKANLDKKADEFAKGALPPDLEKQLNDIADNYAKELAAGFKTEFANLQVALDKAKAEADKAQAAAPAVKTQVDALVASASALQKKLDDMHAKLKAFGGQSAQLVVGSAVKYISGGLL